MEAFEGGRSGIDVDVLSDAIRTVELNPDEGVAEIGVKTVWQGRARSESTVRRNADAGSNAPQCFTVVSDVAATLGGEDSAMSPQELMISAFNASLMVGYVVGAAIKGVELDEIEIETEGHFDVRGLLAIGRNDSPGRDTLRYTVHIKGDGTPEEFREIHASVAKAAPSYFNVAGSISVESNLVVKDSG